MHHTSSMGHRDGVQHIHHQRHGLRRRQGTTLLQVPVQGAAGDVLKHQIRLAAMHIGLVHRHDIGMGHAAGIAGLLQPLGHRPVVRARCGAHDLDRHFPFHARVKRQPHGGLPALPQHAAQLKPP